MLNVKNDEGENVKNLFSNVYSNEQAFAEYPKYITHCV